MILRAPEPTDVDALYLWENDAERLQQGRSGMPLSRQAIWEYVQNYNSNALPAGDLRFMFDDGETKPVGVVDLYDLDLSAERSFVSIYVAKEERNRGLGSKALKELEDFARNHLGLYQLCAIVSTENKPSLSLFRKAEYKELSQLPLWVRSIRGELIPAVLFNKILHT